MSRITEKELLEWGQGHLAEALQNMNADEQEKFLRPFQEAPIPWLLSSIEDAQGASSSTTPPTIVPPKAVDGSDRSSETAKKAYAAGIELLREGRIGILLVAGGMGTRLGWDGPKGAYPVGPLSDRSLFQGFAEQIQRLQDMTGSTIQWAIQTSDSNHVATLNFFQENKWFGLAGNQVRLFSQGTLPALCEDGRVSVGADGSINCLPDGHGGVYRALEKKGVLDWYEEGGVEHVYYFQVDNPLSILAEPQFMGFHALKDSEMSAMVIKKTDPMEKVGVLGYDNGTLRVIEYSEIDPEVASQRDADGQLSLRAGNTGVQAFKLSFLRKMGGERALPVHVAKKPIPWMDEGKVPGFKLEYFVFDALPQASNPLIYEVPREGNFAPVKNAEGGDSPATARDALMRAHRRHLADAGLTVADSRPVEISFRWVGNTKALQEGFEEGEGPLTIP